MNSLKESIKDNYKALHSYLINKVKQDKEYTYFIFKEIKYSDAFSGKEISFNYGYENTITSCFQVIYIYKDYTYNSAYLGIFHENTNNKFKNTGNTGVPAKDTDREERDILTLINTLKEKHKIDKF